MKEQNGGQYYDLDIDIPELDAQIKASAKANMNENIKTGLHALLGEFKDHTLDCLKQFDCDNCGDGFQRVRGLQRRRPRLLRAILHRNAKGEKPTDANRSTDKWASSAKVE